MQLAAKAIVVEIWRGAIIWTIVIIAAIGVVLGIPALRSPIVFAGIGIVVLAVLIELTWLTPVAVRRFRYSVTADGVRTSAGVLFSRESFVPMQQILIVERRQGPLLRPFGLVKIRLRLPGSYVDIDGVTEDAFADLQRVVQAAHATGAHGQAK